MAYNLFGDVMNTLNKCLLAGAGAMLLVGCVVREEPPHRHYYVEEAPAPVEAPAPGYVEVVPASPGIDYVWVPGVYFYDEHGHRMWRHGYYRHR
jgi:hypothetical protein